MLASRPARCARSVIFTSCLAAIAFLYGSPVLAQPTLEGRAVGAIGGYSNPYSSGLIVAGAGGIEVLAGGRFGGGAEIGMFGGGGDAVINLSFDGTIHLRGANKRVRIVPFVAAGYTRLVPLTDTGARDAWHVRAGLNWGIGPHRAIRLEFLEILRHHRWTDYYSFVRVGVTFR